MSRFSAIAILAVVVLQTGCRNEAVTAFSEQAQQLSEALPRVAAIPFNACAELHITQQLSKTTGLPDRHSAEQACAVQAEAQREILNNYGVLTLYMTVLGKLAAGSLLPLPSSANSAASAAARLAGSSTARQSSLSGLAGAIESATVHGRMERTLRRAITEADPHLQALCLQFNSEIVPGLSIALDAEEQELRALYHDPGTGPIRLLLLRQFAADLARIDEERELAKHYGALLTKAAQAHAALYQHRDHLRSRETAADLALVAGQAK